MASDRYRFTVEVSESFAQFIEAESQLRGISKAELFALAFEKLRQSGQPKREKLPDHSEEGQ